MQFNIYMSKLQEFKKRKSQWGLKRCLHWELMHFLSRYFGFRIHYLFVGNSIYDTYFANLPDFTEEYETVLTKPDALLQYADTVPELSEEFLRVAINNGEICTANFYKGMLVGFGFTSRTRTIVTRHIDLLVPQGFRYGYKGWTHPDHRRSNLSRLRTRVRIEHADTPYHERSIWYIETHNYASLLHRHQPPRERNLRVGIIGWFSIFGKIVPFNSRIAKRYGIEMVRKEDSGKRQYI